MLGGSRDSVMLHVLNVTRYKIINVRNFLVIKSNYVSNLGEIIFIVNIT